MGSAAIEPLCRYCNEPAMMCRTTGDRSSRTFRCEAHSDTDDTSPGVMVYTRPTYEHLRLDDELMPAMREAYRRRMKKQRRRAVT